ncbi:hypothetical protein D9619_009590 [Psilocybe cf. subviscida]|uniref:Uncharacterized protein n=1 Tax=Psilocybe cf. subviscida TaxID=2480587 RepID=A0A8H5BKH5_9AGAR|nr:hypothetical protein D9619_009590 [Psilocybe cf. subviscida]
MSTSKNDDPRDASLEVAYTTPNTWYRDTDSLGTSGMFLSGLIMVTRNRFLAWPSVLFGLNNMFNAHPLRSKEGGSGYSNLALCMSALIASYIPLFIVQGAGVGKS